MQTTLIPLTRGLFAIVDEADAPLVTPYRWEARRGGNARYRKRFYAVAKRMDGGSGIVSMHRLILGTPEGSETDHRNHDTLDNRRANLRAASASQNQANRQINGNNRSGYRGVSYETASGRWVATIRVNWRKLWIGRFDTPEMASAAYEAAALRHFGRFAECASPAEAR